MQTYLYLISFILLNGLGECVQPYFPNQIVFSPDNGATIFAIDELNQRASVSRKYGDSGEETSYVMKHFPFAPPDSPQSTYYVQLSVNSPPLDCQYGTYWKYGGNQYNSFPAHWWVNLTTYEIQNYFKFQHGMIHSTNSSETEDHWYANETCYVDLGPDVPCLEIYFIKNTEIPLRSLQVIRRGWVAYQSTTNYKVIAVGKPDDKYFDSIPKDWFLSCRDVMLGLYYEPQTTKIDLKQSVKVQIWLPTPPHRINGNDNVVIQWKPSNCSDCFTFSPKELTFNIKNFQERQTITITRVKAGGQTTLVPTFNGGGFDRVPPETYPIYIQ